MKRTTNRDRISRFVRMTAAVLCAACLTAGLPDAAFGTVQYMPDVNKNMSKASYWSDKVGDPQEVLASRDEIRQLNEIILERSAETRDMAAWSETGFDAEALVEALLKSAAADAEYLWGSGARYYPDGTKADSAEALYSNAIDLCRDPDVPGSDGVYKFAVCTTRTSLTVFPTDQPFQDDPNDPDFDYNYLTQVKVNEPLILRTKSTPLADGRFYYSALSSCGSGWIPADCVAICSDKEEWLDAWDYPADQLLVVLDDKIWTEESNAQPETAKRKLPMGTRLQLASGEESKGMIGGRTAHNNHVVWMPVRKADGTYEKKLALIGENRKVSEGFPDLTPENVISVALNQLGDVYGWGSMLGSDDCSGYIRDVYSCFGLDMPRSSNRNNGAMKSYSLEGMSDREKAAFIKKLPPGTDLIFNGHEMLYLGYEGDRIYVISSVYSLRIPGDDHNTKTLGTVINTLDIVRGDNKTWLHHLYEAIVPFYSADHEDYKVPLNKAEIRGVTDRTYNGAAQKQTPEVILNGSALAEGSDYVISYSNNVSAGTALMTVSGTGSYKGAVETAFSISKAAGAVAAKGKKVKLKYSKLKEKKQTVKRSKAISIRAAEGSLTYQIKSINRKKKKYRKYFSIDPHTGNIKVKKNLRRGTYKLTVLVVAGDNDHEPAAKTVKVRIRVC